MNAISDTTDPFVAKLMNAIGGDYSLLIRENYIDTPRRSDLSAFLNSQLISCLEQGRFQCLESLAESRDWRESVVGIHFAVLMCSPGFVWTRRGKPTHTPRRIAEQIGQYFENQMKELEVTDRRLTARPMLLLQKMLRKTDAVRSILKRAVLEQDCFSTYAAATVVGRHLFSESGVDADLLDGFWKRLQQQDWFDSEIFLESEHRFERSLRFWESQSQLTQSTFRIAN